MKTYQLNDHTITFDEAQHQYWVDGYRVYSISQIVRILLKAPYKNVDEAILKIAAEKGNALRERIARYERYNEKNYHPEMQGYIRLKHQHQFTVLTQDPLVLLFHQGCVVAAGRFDMLVSSPYIKGIGLADIKRMAHIQEDHLLLQLNLYKLAYEQTYKKRIHYLKCIHIRNREAAYLDVLVNPAYTKKMLDDFVKTHPISSIQSNN